VGFWGKLAGIGTAAAGAVTGNPALIGAGAAIFTGDMNAEASKKAAATLDKSAQEAQAVNQRVYDDTRRTQGQIHANTQTALAPYLTLGSGAAGAAGNMLGIPDASSGSTPSMLTGLSPMGATESASPAASPVAAATAPQRAQAVSRSAYAPPTIGGLAAGVVPMAAPDGSVNLVPSNQVAYYTSRGARALDQGTPQPQEMR
jgi:hypothetical protein